jgi:copper chaperone CopZ
MAIRKSIQTGLLALAMLFSASAAFAAPVTYVLNTPGVVWGGTAATARAAVQKLDVSSVESDMNAHTMTVAFDDDKVELDQIVSALHDAGYVVKDQTKVEWSLPTPKATRADSIGTRVAAASRLFICPGRPTAATKTISNTRERVSKVGLM